MRTQVDAAVANDGTLLTLNPVSGFKDVYDLTNFQCQVQTLSDASVTSAALATQPTASVTRYRLTKDLALQWRLYDPLLDDLESGYLR